MSLIDEVNNRRTFAIISHPDAGKTTLTEKLLLYGGAIHLAGSVKARKTGTTKNEAPSLGNTKPNGQTQARKAETAQANASRTTSSSRLGSVMRGIGLFAGGMFLGSVLSHLFGWGSLGWGADILGLLVNIFILYLVIKGAAALWRWLRDRRRR